MGFLRAILTLRHRISLDARPAVNIAIDLDEQAVIYMKRSWRIDFPEMPKERELYDTLERRKVRHLPGCFFGGDLPISSGTFGKNYDPSQESSGADACCNSRTNIEAVRIRSSEVEEKYELQCMNTDKGPEHGKSVRKLQPHVLHVTLFSKIGTRLTHFRRSRDLCTAL